MRDLPDYLVMQEYLRDFLMSLDANKTPHSGRTLFEHLKGVHDLLRDWDNSHDVCLAGLFHSIYGTNTFKHQSMSDRGKLVQMIGVRAELLVHYFSTKDRPFFNSLKDLDKPHPYDFWDKDVRKNLLEIEAANLLEQGGNVAVLRKLAGMKELSNGARAALNCGVV
jgi:hypothetical protein